MHKFPRSLAIVSALAPAGVNALGLGDITLHSALNQDLDAEIPLMVSKSESLTNIQVSLASPEAFANAGIERNFSLSNIRFKSVVRPDGSTVIKVTSRGAVREPLLNFLVEVNWPMGRMYREFTVLLDPPVTLGMHTEVMQTAPVVSGNQEKLRKDFSKDKTSNRRKNTISSYPRRGIQYSGSEVGPTRRNDTLWDIAKRVRVDGSVSHEQVMLALFDNNPHAFYKNNVNALKAGHVLRVPSFETIVQRSQKEARDEFYRQYAVWQNSAKTKSKSVANARNNEKLGSQGHLTLESQIDDSQELNAGGVNKASSAKAELAMEIADTVSQENEELRTRIEELEKQLSKMQQMLTIRSESLATIQADSTKETEVELVESIVEQDDATGLNKETASTEVLEQIEEVAPLVLDTDEELSLSTEQSVDTAVEQASISAPIQKQKKDRPVKRPKAETEKGLLTDILADPTYLVAGGTGAALLGLLAWMFMRRRRQELNDAMESILAVPDESNDVVDRAQAGQSENNIAQDIGTVAESSFLSEFAPSDFDALDADVDEVDPISEADVYLAYGRYQQAEDLIRQAIEKTPERDECKLKLLEIFLANENAKDFESYATKLKKDGKNSNAEFWGKVVEMGVELCPTSSLFSSDLESQDSIAEELDALSEEKENIPSGSDDNLVDFKLDQIDEIASDDNQGLEFDIQSSEDSDNSNEIDFNLTDVEPMAGMDDLSIKEPSDNAIEFETNDANEESIDDGALQFDNEETQNEIEATALDFNEELSSISEPEDLDEATVTFDEVAEIGQGEEANTEIERAQAEDSVGLSTDDGDDTLANLDEVETKLDLAKAYIDMEDERAARDMLNEVIGAGNTAQKNEAEDLIGKLASNG
ncbi:MAG: FimV/HubP family polar landmark protein [Methylococcales bacterium]